MRVDPDIINERRNKLKGIYSYQKYTITVVIFINLTHLQEELTKDYFYANRHFANPPVCKKKKKIPNIFLENQFLCSTCTSRSKKYTDKY